MIKDRNIMARRKSKWKIQNLNLILWNRVNKAIELATVLEEQINSLIKL